MINWLIKLPRHLLYGQQTPINDLAGRTDMKSWLHWGAAWAAAALQTPGREFDPELLLQPGGSVLAVVLWLCTKATRGTRSATRLRAKSKESPATKMNATAGDALATNLPIRIENTGFKVISNWAHRGKLRTCGRGG